MIIDDKLGICDELETQMQQLVDSFRCEWTETVRDPDKRALFRHFANSSGSDESIEWVPQREQQRPADWGSLGRKPGPARRRLPVLSTRWVSVGRVSDFPANLGQTVRYGSTQIAVFNFAATGQWFACQNLCPHRRDMVLARGLLGDLAGSPKVACPMHKKTFSLHTGEGLSDPTTEYRSSRSAFRATKCYSSCQTPKPQQSSSPRRATASATIDPRRRPPLRSNPKRQRRAAPSTELRLRARGHALHSGQASRPSTLRWVRAGSSINCACEGVSQSSKELLTERERRAASEDPRGSLWACDTCRSRRHREPMGACGVTAQR